MWGRGMIEHLKTKIQNYQIEKCQKQYEQEVKHQTDRYGQWLSRDENNVKKLLEALQKEYPFSPKMRTTSMRSLRLSAPL